MVSQEQKDKVQQQEVLEARENSKDEGVKSAEKGVETSAEPGTSEVYVELPAAGKKRGKKRKFRERLVYESEISPLPSIWPIVLAFAIAVMLAGLITNVIIFGVGIILVIVAILGWMFERRKR